MELIDMMIELDNTFLNLSEMEEIYSIEEPSEIVPSDMLNWDFHL